MEKYFESLKKGLTCNLLEENSSEIVNSLGNICNVFGNHDTEIIDTVMQNRTSKKNFCVITSLCAVYMGYTSKCEDMRLHGHWDERNRSSMLYCRENYDTFADVFTSLTELDIRYSEPPRYEYFENDCFLCKYKETRNTALINEVKTFARLHPTLQQSVMGVCLRIIEKKRLVKGIAYPGFALI